MGNCFGVSQKEKEVAFKRSPSYKFFTKGGLPADALENCVAMYLQAKPQQLDEKGGSLSYSAFIKVFNLRQDPYTIMLCKLFDSDGSGHVSFREFVYNLAKFAAGGLSPELAFSYRLYDLDGSGSLDKNELVTILRECMHADLTVYGAPELPGKADQAQKCGIRALVEEVTGRTGGDMIGLKEFQLLCARLPRVGLPSAALFKTLARFSRDPARLVAAMKEEQLRALITGINRTPLRAKPGIPRFDGDACAKRVYRPPAAVVVPPRRKSGSGAGAEKDAVKVERPGSAPAAAEAGKGRGTVPRRSEPAPARSGGAKAQPSKLVAAAAARKGKRK